MMATHMWNRGGHRMRGGQSFREKERQRQGRSMAHRQLFSAKDIQSMRELSGDDPLVPIVYTFPRTKGILETEPVVKIGLGHPFPRFDWGFQQWLYQSKDSLFETMKTMGGSRTYHITNHFAHRIEGKEEESVESKTIKFFGLEKKPGIMSRAFYKMWEMIVLFDLVPTSAKVNTVHLAEAPGSFIQACILFRDKFAKSSKGDRHYGITLHSEEQSVPEMEQKFMDYYKDRLDIHKTVPGDRIGKGKDNGDLTDPNTIGNFASENPGTADLVTADGGKNWKNENQQEQESYMLMLGQVICALVAQKTGGAFVLKMYDTFTTFSMKLIVMLSEAYGETHIIKPLMSRDTNAERYIVCTNFKLSEDKRKKLVKRLIDSLTTWRSTGFQAQDIFTDYRIPEALYPTIRAINTQLGNRQLICIHKTILYIKENDRYGKTYSQYLERQIESSRWWTGVFYRDTYEGMKKYMLELQTKINALRTLNLADDTI